MIEEQGHQVKHLRHTVVFVARNERLAQGFFTRSCFEPLLGKCNILDQIIYNFRTRRFAVAGKQKFKPF